MRDEGQRLERLAKAIHLACEEGTRYGRGDWQDVVVDAGLGIDRRTAESYFRLAKVRRLIQVTATGRWSKGAAFDSYLHNAGKGGP